MIKIRAYANEDEEGILQLFTIPVSGNIGVSLEREPSYLSGAYVQTEVPNIFVCEELKTKGIVGVFNIGLRRVYYDSEIVFIPYFCDLRIHPSYQKGFVLLSIIRFIGTLELHLHKLPALTIVFSDNFRMMKMIQKRREVNLDTKIPFYHEVAKVTTFVFLSRSNKLCEGSEYKIRRATAFDIDAMAKLQMEESYLLGYQPYYEFSKIENSKYYSGLTIENYFLAFKNDSLIGICAYWDLHHLKQTVVRSYAWGIRMIRPFYNLISGILGSPSLPAVGTPFKTIYIHTIIIQGRKAEVFKCLLQGIMKQVESIEGANLLCTLDDRDPLCKVFQNIHFKILKKGICYLVNWQEKLDVKINNKFYCIDAPRI